MIEGLFGPQIKFCKGPIAFSVWDPDRSSFCLQMSLHLQPQAGLDTSKIFYLPNSQNYVFLQSACIKYRRNLCSNTLTIPDLSRAVRQWDMSSLAQGEPGPSITNVFATRRKNFSQWHRSFQRKLLSHWLKFLRHVAITLVIQGPGPHLLTSRSQNAIKIS